MGVVEQVFPAMRNQDPGRTDLGETSFTNESVAQLINEIQGHVRNMRKHSTRTDSERWVSRPAHAESESREPGAASNGSGPLWALLARVLLLRSHVRRSVLHHLQTHEVL